MEDIFALFAPNQSVFIDAANGGVESGDRLIPGECPARNPELLLVGVYPEFRQIEITNKLIFGQHLGLMNRDLFEDPLGFLAEFGAGFLVEMSIEIKKGFFQDLTADERRRLFGRLILAGASHFAPAELHPSLVTEHDLKGECFRSMPGTEPYSKT